MKPRYLLNILLVFAFLLSACAQATPAPQAAPTEPAAPAPTQAPPDKPEPSEPPAAPTETEAEEAGPPPQAEPVEPPTTETEFPDDGLEYVFANPPEYDQSKIDMDYDGRIITVSLRPGATWSDGTPISSQDILGTYEIYWATKQFIWDYIEKMEAIDDLTVVFYLNDLNFRSQRFILRDKKIFPYSQYGELMDRAAALRQAGSQDSAEYTKFMEDLAAFRPQDPVVSGPFMVENPGDITESQIRLVKNPAYFNADKIEYNDLIYYFGESAACAPLHQSGMVDFSNSAYSPAIVDTFEQMGLTVLRTPLGAGMGIGFNWKIHPFELKEVRQAFAYIIDREQNAVIGNGKSAKPFEYMSGLPDSAAEVWAKDILDELNRYELNHAKAEELLTSVGFTKGADGIWVDDTGKKMEYKMWVPGGWVDTLGMATDAAEQLTQFGIKVEVQPYQDAERKTIMEEGRFELIADLHGSYFNPPHPYRFFELNFLPYFNDYGNEVTPGMSIPYDWELDGEPVNIKELIAAMVAGQDLEAQQEAIHKMVRLYNENLFTVPMWERLAANPVDTTRSTGWLPWDHPIYQNSHSSDHYTYIQLLSGILKPGPDMSYHGCNPYVQPPKGHFNWFTSDAYFQERDADILYPPLFYYMFGYDMYIPMLGATFEVLK